MEIYWRDNVKARELGADGTYRAIDSDGAPFSAQDEFLAKAVVQKRKISAEQG
jgi:hypothetical protein